MTLKTRDNSRENGHMSYVTERIADKAVVILCLLILVFLTIISALYTEWPIDENEIVFQHADSVPGNLSFLLFFIAFFSLARFFLHKSRDLLEKIVRGITVFGTIYALVFSLVWVYFSCVQAYADGWDMCQMAFCIDLGEYRVMGPQGYLGECPHQYGIVFILQIIFRIFGELNYYPFQYFNALHMPLLLFAGYRCVWYIFQKKEICFYYWILMIGYLPLWMYVPFVYGEISSITYCLVLFWQTLRFCREGKKSAIVWAALAAGVACQLRMNSLIMVIACSLILFFYGFCHKKFGSFFVIASMIAGVFLASGLIRGHYERLAGVEIGRGIPASAYILMGLHESERGPGWYSGLNSDLYQEHNQDTRETDAYCREAIRDRLEELAQGGMLDFFYRKLKTQWNEPDCNIYYETERGIDTVEKIPWLAIQVYTGTGRALIHQWMDRYQFMIYVSVLALVIAMLFRRNDIPALLPFVAVIGGFLFSILWEGKSRYVLPYMICLVMLSGGGIYAIQEGMLKLWTYVTGKRGIFYSREQKIKG